MVGSCGPWSFLDFVTPPSLALGGIRKQLGFCRYKNFCAMPLHVVGSNKWNVQCAMCNAAQAVVNANSSSGVTKCCVARYQSPYMLRASEAQDTQRASSRKAGGVAIGHQKSQLRGTWSNNGRMAHTAVSATQGLPLAFNQAAGWRSSHLESAGIRIMPYTFAN